MLGIDVGGTGIKGGIVDSEQGVIMGERYRLATPHPATPESVTKTVARVDEYLHRLAFYLWPDLIIIGGGVSKKHDRFLPLLSVDTEIVPAMLRNQAGIVGAACASATAHPPP